MRNKLRLFASPPMKILMLICLVIAVFVFAMFQGGFVSWFLFYSFSPFALYPLLLSVYSIKNIEVSRRFNRMEYKMGDQIEVEIVIKSPRFLPFIYIIVEDRIADRFRIQSDCYNHGILYPLFQKELKLVYTIPNVVRGEHEFDSIVIKTGDFLGLYEKKVSIPCSNRILVFPNYEKISFQQLEAFYEQGQHASAVRNHSETSIVSGVRDYMAGDRLSWIHWKATAKKNEIMTKEFEERKSQDVVIILDQLPSTSFEEMVSFVASLTHSILSKGVGVAFAGTANFNHSTFIGRGEQQRMKVFYMLAKVEDTEMNPIDYHFHAGKHAIPTNASYIIVTSQLSKSMISTLSVMRGHTKTTLFVMKENPEIGSLEESLRAEAILKGISCRFIQAKEWRSSMGEGLSK